MTCMLSEEPCESAVWLLADTNINSGCFAKLVGELEIISKDASIMLILQQEIEMLLPLIWGNA